MKVLKLVVSRGIDQSALKEYIFKSKFHWSGDLPYKIKSTDFSFRMFYDPKGREVMTSGSFDLHTHLQSDKN